MAALADLVASGFGEREGDYTDMETERQPRHEHRSRRYGGLPGSRVGSGTETRVGNPASQAPHDPSGGMSTRKSRGLNARGPRRSPERSN